MDNNFDDEGDEIVEEDELVDSDVIMDDAIDDLDESDDYFEQPGHIIFLNDPAGLVVDAAAAGDANEMSSSGAASTGGVEDQFSLANLSPEHVKAINEFSLEKHVKV